MKNKNKIILPAVLTALALTLSSCSGGADWRPNKTGQSVSSDTLSVERVENVPSDFILGMDASCVPSLEDSGVKYYDFDGQEKDVFEILSDNGVNYIRVRVWNDPYDGEGRGYGGGNCDIANAVNIGKRAAKYGMKLLVDFHYSDFWADPAKQKAPKAWANLMIDEKADALYAYTKESLELLVREGVLVGMVQIGNETNGSMCGVSDWKNIAKLMSSGVAAVREVCPEALAVLHFTNPEKTGSYAYYAKKLDGFGVDYDVFASSYYPYWHGTRDNLAAELSGVANTYNKKVMIAETSYAFTSKNSDFHPNTVSNGISGYPLSIEGQAKFLRDVVDTAVNKTASCIGVFYWEGTWISVGAESYEKNSALWEKHGSGWASSYAAEYDPDDAGKWYGGCAVENQAFFDEHGRANESLKAFGLLKNQEALED